MLSICVLAFNHPELTDRCCQSLMQQVFSGIPFERLVVDNGSATPYQPPAGWRVHRLEQNVGGISGQNVCFQAAQGDWVLFISNDVVFLPEALQKLWMWKFYGQLMPLILNPDDLTVQSAGGSWVWPGYGINRTSGSPWMRCDYCPSITYLMPKRLWHSVGGFNETLPGAYEDVDLGLKIDCRCTDEAKVTHAANSTLRYRLKDRWRFQVARQRVVQEHYRGIDRWLRLKALQLLSRGAPDSHSV